MKYSTKSKGSSKRRARSEQTETIQRNGKIMATIRMRPGEMDFQLGPEMRDIPGVHRRFKYGLMEAVEQFLDLELDDESSDDP